MSRNTSSSYECGWIASSIHHFFAVVDSVPASMAWCLVTGLDSSCRIAAIWKKSPHLLSIRDEGRIVGAGVVVPTRVLAAADQKQKLFFGFDEVWFAPRSDLTEKPADLSLVGPRRVSRETLEPFEAWLQTNEISLGLGDGGGMNYCARLTGIARLLSRAGEHAEASEPCVFEYEPAGTLATELDRQRELVGKVNGT